MELEITLSPQATYYTSVGEKNNIMKIDIQKQTKRELRFNKNELIDILLEKYQTTSKEILPDIDKSKCFIYANGKETMCVDLIIIIEENEAKDYNGTN